MMQEAGLEEVEAYALRRYNNFSQYISMRLIMDLCEEAVHRTGRQVLKRWWEQEGLEFAGGWEATAALEREPDMTDGVVGGG